MDCLPQGDFRPAETHRDFPIGVRAVENLHSGDALINVS
jgi:hypothetical protein